MSPPKTAGGKEVFMRKS